MAAARKAGHIVALDDQYQKASHSPALVRIVSRRPALTAEGESGDRREVVYVFHNKCSFVEGCLSLLSEVVFVRCRAIHPAFMLK